MRLFKKSSPAWPPSWTYDAGAYIWRFVFSGAGHILGETRDPERKTTSFFCLAENDGTVLWEGLQSDEEWWVGFEAVESGRFYLHGFRKPDMPQHLGIRAHDLATGKALWRNDDLAFVLARDQDVYGAREGFSGMEFFRLSAADGSVAEELGQDITKINVLRGLLNEEEDYSGYRYPEPFSQEHPAFAAAAAPLQTLLDPARVIGNLDVLVEKSLLLAAWHEAKENSGATPALRQHLAALALPRGKALYETVLLEEADAPGMDSFFLKDAQLLYIKNRRVLTAHDLNGVSQ
ncbi:MAG: DUF4905 domain-containing protein [Bacteroidota bacterium]|nr:DUF4905 domain-containing protein [Bacteroidota bacterium]